MTDNIHEQIDEWQSLEEAHTHGDLSLMEYQWLLDYRAHGERLYQAQTEIRLGGSS